MALLFYLGASGSGKSYKLYKDINEAALKERDKNFLFIVPDQFTMQAQIDLVKASPNGGIMNVDVLSFSRLAYRIFEETGYGSETVLDDTGKSLVLRVLANKIAPDMPILGRNLNKIGYIHEIKSIISEFKQYGIDETRLDELIAKTESRALLNMKLKDIKVIYKEFNDYIRDEFITKEETMTLLTEAVGHSNIIKGSVVVFDGFTGFTPVQYRLIQRLLELTDKVIVSVTIDINADPYHINSEQELFYLSKKTIKDLQRISEGLNLKKLPDIICDHSFRFDEGSELSHLEKNIFRYPIRSYQGENKAIHITECETIKDEINNTCSQIKELVYSGKYAYRDIAVVCGDLSAYSDDFKEALSDFDIPFFIDQNEKLLLNPFVEYVRSALNIVRDNFSYDSVFHFLRCGIAPFESHDIDIFDNYVLSCGIRGRKKYSEVFSLIPESAKSKDEKISDEDIEKLNKLNEIRQNFADLLSPLVNAKGTATGYCEALMDFLEKADVSENLSRYQERFLESKLLRKAGEYSRIYGMITDLIAEIKTLLKDEEMDISEFIGIFEAGVDEMDIGSIPEGIDRVVIGDIIRSRISGIKVLFLMGANDGNIPKSNSKGGIISDMDREFLKEINEESGIELSPTPREQIYTQRLYLYINLTKPSERLYVSYADMSRDGKALKESYIIMLLKKLFPGISIERNDVKAEDGLNISGLREGILKYAEYIGEYAQDGFNDEGRKKELMLLRRLLRENPESTEIAAKLTDTAFFEYKSKNISPETAVKLYGAIIKCSISRLEMFARCEYAHFLRYGMGLKEREEFDFETRDLGNIYHYTLKGFASRLEREGLTFADFNDEDGRRLIDETVKEVSVQYGSGILYSTFRNEYMVRKITDIMLRSVVTLRDQLKSGLFLPEGYEKSFEYEINLNEEEKMLVRGQIDRLDIYRDDDTVYIKIVDFKSGKKDIELDSLLYGLQLQMPVYMINASKLMMDKYPSLTPKMAAMLYYHIDDPYVRVKDENDKDEINEKIMDELVPAGLVNSDVGVIKNLDTAFPTGPESYKSKAIPVSVNRDGSFSSGAKVIADDEFNELTTYVSCYVKETAQRIKDGNMAVNPYRKGDKNACEYCDYKSICGFDENIPGFKMRELKSLKRDEALEAIKEKNEVH